ncbi:insulin receptor substrate 2-B [Brienomyrus brachyistius]|uniref:insulin receptor substrate 2-B n=1 Tax=Brienomyrus brachyistius TaxID=42636 RepID=UPI0020B2A66E|nr:insulin receptor substrate 2-B [Brienomyrus brachyistius]
MADLLDLQGSGGAMLMLETPRRDIGTKTAAAAAGSADGDSGTGAPTSPLLIVGGARLCQHVLEERDQQADCPAQRPGPAEDTLEASLSKSHSSLNLVPCDASVNNTQSDPGASAARSEGVDGDVWKCGYLRKQKHGHKRFFVLRGPSHTGPSRLEYYDSEKKFRNSLRFASTSSTACPAKRVIYLYQCFTVNKRADAKNKYLIALYTKDECFAMIAENEQEQEDWYLALSDLMSEGKKGHLEADELDDSYGADGPGAVFKEVWQVNVKPKGLGQTKNLTGVYRLCLSAKTMHLMKLNAETPCVNLQLMNIRRCGHSESFFFIEVGRSSSIGPGEIWMQVDDSVVAQSMHETILETMKALKAFAEFRPRSKSQSSGSNPIAFITTRRLLGNLPPSQTGLQRRSRTETVVGTPPAGKSSTVNSYRFRTSSEGEGTMSRPYRSVTGSLIHLNSARANLARPEGAGRYMRAIPSSNYHTRSASLPVSHFPSNSSPVSVSSSSGHGSVSEALTRPSSASICGSPSDGGFASSDEYGSSPCDFRYFRVRSNTPDSLGNTPPIREENSLSDYMAMDRHREAVGGAEGLQDETVFEERPTRKLTSSSRPPSSSNSGVSATYQKTTQTTPSLDEPDGSSFGRRSLQAYSSPTKTGNILFLDQYCETKPPSLQDDPQKPKDDGYMPMMPGVASLRDTDYMPMQPHSCLPASSSQQMDTQGYMMMLPRAGPFPAQTSPRGGGNRPKDGEYMDMSQGGGTHQARGDGYYAPTPPETPKSYSSYFSLPRSYKAPERDSHSEYVPMCSPAKVLYAGDECISSSPVKDPPIPLMLHNGCGELHHSDKHLVRPTRLSLDQQKASESPDPPAPPASPGEYINIDFRDRPAFTPCSMSTDGSPSSLGSAGEHRRSPLHEDYMSLETDSHPDQALSPQLSLVAPWNPPSYNRSPVLASMLCSDGQVDDYTEMTFCSSEKGCKLVVQPCDVGCRFPQLPPTSPKREPKVIRADPQGRRRHSSETFASTPAGITCTSSSALMPAGPHLADGAKWHSSVSFDSVWLHMEAAATPDAGSSPAPTEAGCAPGGRIFRNTSAGYQNGLNYIALDLREEPQPNCGGSGAPLAIPPSPPASLSLAENAPYASIDFSKSEVLTSISKE